VWSGVALEECGLRKTMRQSMADATRKGFEHGNMPQTNDWSSIVDNSGRAKLRLELTLTFRHRKEWSRRDA